MTHSAEWNKIFSNRTGKVDALRIQHKKFCFNVAEELSGQQFLLENSMRCQRKRTCPGKMELERRLLSRITSLTGMLNFKAIAWSVSDRLVSYGTVFRPD
jgi:hypothetical protein